MSDVAQSINISFCSDCDDILGKIFDGWCLTGSNYYLIDVSEVKICAISRNSYLKHMCAILKQINSLYYAKATFAVVLG